MGQKRAVQTGVPASLVSADDIDEVEGLDDRGHTLDLFGISRQLIAINWNARKRTYIPYVSQASVQRKERARWWT